MALQDRRHIATATVPEVGQHLLDARVGPGRQSANQRRAAIVQRTGSIDSTAPVQGQASIEVAAPAGLVFDVLADVEGWPRFIPGVSRVNLADAPPLAEGTAFTWRNQGFGLRSTIQRATHSAELTWTGQALWLVAVHLNTITPTLEGGCQLKSSESMAGFGAGVLMSSTALHRQLAEFVLAIAEESERRAHH